MFSMQYRTSVRRVLLSGIIFLIIYFIFFQRYSPRVFLTVLNINEYEKQNKLNITHHRRIPRIIHQTWKTKDVPIRWNQTVESVRQLNAEQFDYRLWTDEDMHAFVSKEEPYLYEHVFRKYPFDIQRVDAFRYIVLHRLGGLYIDMDNGASQSFDSLLSILESLDQQSAHLAAFPRTSPVGISNGFMISTKGHPFFKILVSRLSSFNYNYLIGYITVMFSAGPSYLSINEFYFDTSSTKSVIRIIDEIVYSSVYTWHTPGNSWHGSDAKIILYVYHSVRKISSQVYYGLLLIIGLIISFVLYHRQKKKKF
jgi:mannosyltransferase OCH1-like enzyme